MKIVLFLCLFSAVPILSQTVDAVTESLTHSVTNDSEKVVRIYEWITKNVRYESRYQQHRVEGDTSLWQEPYNVILRKKAVCIGYAKLFRAMCQSAKIECYVVIGFAKSTKGTLENDEHAWNVVKINANWFVLDATWGINSKDFFLTDPSVFLESHYPHDPMWQLLAQPKTFSCFVENKKCWDRSPVFNFRDTIDFWMGLDSINRVKNSSERSLRYNANSIEAIRNIANANSEEAFQIFETYFKWREKTILKQNPNEKPDEVFNLINMIEDKLHQARFFYDRLTTFARKNEFTDAHLNRDLMQENLLKLENERRYVEKYFKK